MRRILVVEDESSIREMIALNLNIAGYEVVEAQSGEHAIQILMNETIGFDTAILDLMLPGMNGFSLCEYMRKSYNNIGIMILSAKSQEADKITGLSIGADDYMTKPFSVTELLARVDALCRRVSRIKTERTEDNSLVSGSFALNQKSRILFKEEKEIELTQIEYQIIEFFFNNVGVALAREKILIGVWGDGYFGDVKIVDVNIRRLRMKIEADPSTPQHIMTVWGFGYRWNA